MLISGPLSFRRRRTARRGGGGGGGGGGITTAASISDGCYSSASGRGQCTSGSMVMADKAKPPGESLIVRSTTNNTRQNSIKCLGHEPINALQLGLNCTNEGPFSKADALLTGSRTGTISFRTVQHNGLLTTDTRSSNAALPCVMYTGIPHPTGNKCARVEGKLAQNHTFRMLSPSVIICSDCWRSL